MSDAADFQSVLDALKGPGAAGGLAGGDPMMTMMMMQMERDRQDRKESRATMMQMLTVLGPLIVPMLLKKEADPVMMTLLQTVLTKNNDGEQLKQMLQMMAAGNQMTMEQMKNSLLSIMELKDQQTKKLLEDASNREDDGPASGPAAIMREIRLGLGSVAGLLPQAQQAEAPAAPALPAPNPGQPAAAAPGQRPPPIVVVLHQLQAIQTGKVKENPAAWAALSCVALQDDQLLAALDDCDEDDLQPLFAYCLPHLKASQPLMAWIGAEGVAAWVDDRVRAKLLPLIDAARGDEDGGDEGEATGDEAGGQPAAAVGGNEPEELRPEAAEG